MKNLIGNTPLIKISDKIYAKLETYNPSGSIKDRMAYYILVEAKKRWELKPGDTIETKCAPLERIISTRDNSAIQTMCCAIIIQPALKLSNKQILSLLSLLALELAAP